MTDAIRNWSLSASNKDNLYAKIDALDLSLGYLVTVKLKQATRNELQNNSYWQFVTEFAEYTGDDKEYLHNKLRYRYLYEIIEIDGVEYRNLLSTTKQTVKAMAEYIDKCLMCAGEAGFYFEFKH